jgi:hypothetical protein
MAISGVSQFLLKQKKKKHLFGGIYVVLSLCCWCQWETNILLHHQMAAADGAQCVIMAASNVEKRGCTT